MGPGTQRYRVLVVSEDSTVGERLAAALDVDTGPFRIDEADNADRALQSVRSGDLDCLVTAYELPETTGLELLESVRDLAPNLPVILFPAAGDEWIASEAIELGATSYVPRSGGDRSYERAADCINTEVPADERSAQQEIALYRQILETLDDAVYAIESDGTIVYVNESYARMKGIPRDELLGTDIYGWVTEETAEKARQARERLAEGNQEVAVVEYDFVAADGEQFPAEMRFTKTQTAGGTIDRAGVIRDVSDRVQREKSLRQKNEQLDQFASIVSHDLRNPLNVAKTRLELAADECSSPHLDDVGGALERIEGLLEDLLTLAKQGDEINETEAIDLDQLARTAWQSVETHDATLECKYEAAVQADPSRLRQLLENLYRNAIDHAGTDVTVRIGPVDESEGFYVADDGPGIPVAEPEKIFESGFTTDEEGTGFGLAIVDAIAEGHGWTVTVTDGADGGARFEVSGVDLAAGPFES